MKLALSLAAGASISRWTPAKIGSSQLKLWLRADSLTAGAVATWPDLSGNGKDATQSTANLRPIASTSVAALNGQAGVLFDGDTGANPDVMTLPDLGVTGEADVIGIIRLDSYPPAGAALTGLWRFGTDSGSADVYPWTDGHIYDGTASTARKDLGVVANFSPAPNLGAVHSFMVRSAANSYVARINGNQVFSTATNAFGMAAAPTLGKSVSTQYLKGYVAEIMVLSPRATADQLTKLQAYFTKRYGVSV